MNNFQTAWYVIYTKPRHEKRVQERLIRLQIDCFLPTQKILKSWGCRKKYVNEPLFPSYIFVYLKDLKDYYSGIDIQGSLGYIKIGKDIAKVRDTVMNNIKAILNSEIKIEVTNTHFATGQKVVISTDLFHDIECEFVSYKNKSVGLVRISLLHRNILISLPVLSLSPQ